MGDLVLRNDTCSRPTALSWRSSPSKIATSFESQSCISLPLRSLLPSLKSFWSITPFRSLASRLVHEPRFVISDLAQLTARRDALMAARYRGVRTFD